jgi:hypothetical protein
MQVTPPQPPRTIDGEVAEAYLALPLLARVRERLQRRYDPGSLDPLADYFPDHFALDGFGEDVLELGAIALRLNLWPVKRKRERSDENLGRGAAREHVDRLKTSRDEVLRAAAKKLLSAGISKREAAKRLTERFQLSEEAIRKKI